MARTIKKIAHDLSPLTDACAELSLIISEILDEIKLNAKFDDKKMFERLSECEEASRNLALSSGLIEKYIFDLNKEADREGIAKD